MDFKLDRAGFDAEVLCADFMLAEMRKRGERVKAAAEASAPVDEQSPHAGRYKDSFHLEVGIEDSHGLRAVATVYNDAPEALFVEYGTKNNPRHRTLGKALDAAG